LNTATRKEYIGYGEDRADSLVRNLDESRVDVAIVTGCEQLISNPNERAAACTSSTAESALTALVGFTRTAIVVAPGTIS